MVETGVVDPHQLYQSPYDNWLIPVPALCWLSVVYVLSSTPDFSAAASGFSESNNPHEIFEKKLPIRESAFLLFMQSRFHSPCVLALTKRRVGSGNKIVLYVKAIKF